MLSDPPQAETFRGFTPKVQDPSEWLASCARVIAVPRVDAGDESAADGLLITHWPESMGQFEKTIAELDASLADDAVLAMSLQHRYAPSRLREQLDLRPDPHVADPALSDREIEFSIERVIRGVSSAGFVVEDVQHEFGHMPSLLGSHARDALIRDGLSVVPEPVGERAERLFVRARKAESKCGSVLVAVHHGDSSLAERTIESLQTYLPESWEILVGPECAHESESWNDAFAKSTGDRVWLLRAGDEPAEDHFRVVDGVATSCFIESDDSAQGLGGALLTRAVVLRVGAFLTSTDSEIVAGEEWRLRAETLGHTFRTIVLERPWPGKTARPGVDTARAAEEMMARWDRSAGRDETVSAGPARASTPWRVANRAPTISLCMIVRDEEQLLPQCLERVRPAVDEIIVVDTGSKDRTVEIARDFGARVLHHEWNDDFSEPRNVSLAAATGDWVLVLDADELVDEAAVPKLRLLAESEVAAGFHLRFVNVSENTASHGITMPRFFRRFDSLRYVNAIHEQVIESLQVEASARGLSIYPSDLRVIHHGYEKAIVSERGKEERNLRIFEKQLERTPDDAYCLYKFGDFLRSTGASSTRVIDMLERAYQALLSLPRSKLSTAPFASEVVALLGLELAKAERFDEADRIVRAGLQRFSPTPNAFYVAAGIAQHLGAHDDALDWFHRLLDYDGRSLVVPVQEGITSYVARAGIAVSLAHKGHVERAEQMLASLRATHPYWEPLWIHSAAVALQREDPAAAIEMLATAISKLGPRPALCELGASILDRLGMAREADKWRARPSETSIHLGEGAASPIPNYPVQDGFPDLIGAGVPEGARP